MGFDHLVARGIHGGLNLGLGGFFGVERNVGLAVEKGNAVDVNDARFLGKELGQVIRAADADESLDFEEGLLASDGEAGGGEGLFEISLVDLGRIEINGDRFGGHLQDFGPLDFVDGGLSLTGGLFLVQPVCKQDQAFFGRKVREEEKENCRNEESHG